MLGCAGLMTVATIGGAYALYSGTAKTVENKFNIVAGADHGTEGFDPSNPDGPTDGDGIYDSADDLEPGQKVLKNPSIMM